MKRLRKFVLRDLLTIVWSVLTKHKFCCFFRKKQGYEPEWTDILKGSIIILFGKRVEIVVKQYSTRVLELNLQILPRQNFTRRDGESLNRTILNLLFSLHYIIGGLTK